MANALSLTSIILKRLSKCLHNHRHCQIERNYGNSNPKVSEQSHIISGKVYLRSVKISPTNSSAAATLFSSSAFECDISSTSMVEHTSSEIAAYSSARRSAKPKSTKHYLESMEFHHSATPLVIDGKAVKKLKSKKARALNPEPRATLHTPTGTTADAGTPMPRGFALPPYPKPKPSTDEFILPFKGIVKQNIAQEGKSAQAPGRTMKAATNISSSETSTPRSRYHQHIEELEKYRVILCNLKHEYSQAKADYDRSEATLQCLRRQDQHPLRFWRKQKRSAERSLGQTARKLQKTRILERDMLIKVRTKPQLCCHG